MKFVLKKMKTIRGFTLVELLVVMMILSVLASIAVPTYRRHQIKALETVLAEDLYQMRRAIDAHYADKRAYPEALQDLVDGHYLRALPRDPFTRETQSWKCIAPEPTEDGELENGGCFDVKSGSNLVGLDGVAYQDW